MITDFHFLRPYALLLSVPMLLIIWRLLRCSAKSANWSKACDAHLLQHLLQGDDSKPKLSPLLLLSVAWLIVVFSLAGPSWQRVEQPILQTKRTQVIVMEMSKGLYVQDIKPNRLSRARYKIEDLLKRQSDWQTGFVAYTDEPYVVSPITQDHKTLLAMLAELSPNIMPVPGHNIAQALEKAYSLFQGAGIKRGRIILLAFSQPARIDFDMVKQLRAEGITTSILGIGTQQGGPIPTNNGFLKDEAGNIIINRLAISGLSHLAHAGGGYYQSFSNESDDINQLARVTPSLVNATKQQQKIISDEWYDVGHYLLIMLLPIAALAFRKTWFEALVEK